MSEMEVKSDNGLSSLTEVLDDEMKVYTTSTCTVGCMKENY